MALQTDLENIDHLITRLSEPIAVAINPETEWKTAQQALAALVVAAQELGLPWRNASQYVTRLKHHIGVLLGAIPPDGHTQEQHIGWALGDLKALRSSHAFGPALARLEQGPSGAVH